ncbi:hypothetical protein R1flu_020611 [Riccia fluitans]|uniref:Uncharacterized protein n=1 Tax=Riccia fluitans TaxID=41844 RepID=A0ABD1ZM03_9MARC
MSLFVQTCGARSFKKREEENSSSSPRSPGSPGNSGPRSPGSSSGWRRARMMMGFHRASSQRSLDDAEPSGSRQTSCAICLETLKAGQGQALFTAECSHTFHFSCIASNAQHGNLICPVCRAKWKQVPWRAPTNLPALDPTHRPPERRRNQLGATRHPPRWSPHDSDEDQDAAISARAGRGVGLQEPSMFNDDEPLVSVRNPVQGSDSEVQGEGTLTGREVPEESSSSHTQNEVSQETVTEEHEVNIIVPKILVRGYPQVDEVAAASEVETFTILVNAKAGIHDQRIPSATIGDGNQTAAEAHDSEPESSSNPLHLDPNNRAPLDLITVLDISSSMTGNKLRLLKCAMEFVINHLSPADRLSVVTFSSSAKRLFPLRRMVEDGRQFALRYVNSLAADGGTNIAEGLRKGTKVLEDRRMRNPVASIMLLSDGQDTYNMRHTSHGQFIPGGRRSALGSQIPVHTFGFGEDHDADLMHSIAESSGGTFSFIQTESAVQDAFAQCIGGLLSVVVQNAQIKILAGDPGVQIRSIQAGTYQNSITDDRRQCIIKIGDLYAEEEKDVLVDVKLPSAPRPTEEATGRLVTKLLQVSCSFQDPIAHDEIETSAIDIIIHRPEAVNVAEQTVRLEVDRQRNRMQVAQSIVEAGALADAGEILAALAILSSAKESLQLSAAFEARDELCLALETELLEIESRMQNHQTYQRSGRAYVLSVQSSHSQQRATTRGNLSENRNRDHYRTPSMMFMVAQSQMQRLQSAPLSTTGNPPSAREDSRNLGTSLTTGRRSAPLASKMPVVGESEGSKD